MKTYLKNKFSLTEQGGNDLVKASIASFFVFLTNMLPAFLLLLTVEQILGLSKRHLFFYLLASLLTLGLCYLTVNREYLALYTATYRESANLRIALARKLRDLPMSYLSKHRLTDLAQSMMKDVTTLEHALSHALPKFLGFIAFFLLASLCLLLGHWQLGLCVVLPIVFFFFFFSLSKRIMVSAQQRFFDQERRLAASFQEGIELQREIKSFAQGEQMQKELEGSIDLREKWLIRTEFLPGILLQVCGFILYFSIGLVLVFGTYLYTTGSIDLLYVVGYLLAAWKLKEGSEAIGVCLAEIYLFDVTAKRLQDIQEQENQGGEDVSIQNFDLQLENVGFAYEPPHPVLEEVGFRAKAGEVTALVGKSGCGKTTLLRLLSRLYDYDHGVIWLDGKPLQQISSASLYPQLSIVFQEVILFNQTVMENIRMGRLTASDEEVREAARLAHCEEFILRMEQGYETPIGENGIALSGGERQRLSIARAFLKQAPILILDEIAANLDVENEQYIQDSLRHLVEGKTVIVISHRMRSIENADKIVVLHEGRVEAVGRHEELLQCSPTYRLLLERTKKVETFSYR